MADSRPAGSRPRQVAGPLVQGGGIPMKGRGVMGKWSAEREREWARGHRDELARKARRAMAGGQEHYGTAKEGTRRTDTPGACPPRHYGRAFPPDGSDDSGDGNGQGITTGLRQSANRRPKGGSGADGRFLAGRKLPPTRRARTAAAVHVEAQSDGRLRLTRWGRRVRLPCRESRCAGAGRPMPALGSHQLTLTY